MQVLKKILAVGDDVVNLRIIETLLAGNYELKTACSGEEALEIAADFLPDIILLDSALPCMSGSQVCQQVRKDPRLRYAKVIMVSEQTDASNRIEAYRAGVDDYVTKPFDRNEMLAKIRVYLRLKSAEEVDQFKTNILTLLGHEARTPLNSLIGSAEMLMSEKDIDAEEQRTFIELVHGAAKRLHCLFEKVIMLSSLKSGRLQLNMTSVNLCDIIREAIKVVTEKAEKQDIKIESEYEDSFTICLDKQEIEKVIIILLENAISFSPPNGSVKVRVFKENSNICLSVTDQGNGISPDYLPYVFDGLYKPDVSHHSVGDGLSLAIARQVILQHNGTIDANNEGCSGTTLTVRLPIAAEVEEMHEAHCGK